MIPQKYRVLLPLNLLLLIGFVSLAKLSGVNQILSTKSFLLISGMLLVICAEMITYRRLRKIED
ncbi:hypothetical protein FD51_GL000781 [Lacticaseibacillus zeae DSM 20178 = KCTC 3804]|uniref:Uncharacterized protein n=1 Tax=Lacticaseibacillus zeae DSM 20178 = KCTC 3804 TaxID=1423816 RepID=A0A0R1EZN7_LACZE|nr:hypothetical protein FD51_GL000781 [Lacticaseibacillus zeae DSM 20178 = KCTC 3804]